MSGLARYARVRFTISRTSVMLVSTPKLVVTLGGGVCAASSLHKPHRSRQTVIVHSIIAHLLDTACLTRYGAAPDYRRMLGSCAVSRYRVYAQIAAMAKKQPAEVLTLEGRE